MIGPKGRHESGSKKQRRHRPPCKRHCKRVSARRGKKK